MDLLKTFSLVLVLQTFLAFSEGLECIRSFTLINNHTSTKEIINKRQGGIDEGMNLILQSLQNMESPSYRGNALRDIKMHMMRYDGGMGYGSSYLSNYSTSSHRLNGNYYKMLEMIIDAISSLSIQHSRVKHNLWNHIMTIAKQKNDTLFPSDIENAVVKKYFDPILNFLIDYLEYKDLQIAINLSIDENRVRIEQTTIGRVKRIHNLLLSNM